ncbi:hypothetical protein ACRALDRAFT_1065480 [Sodiomyces alcalophilus JCM 7366]|uniref:uncharacterized protein n=1 Tax=Sodiomyces alcalophilus JCM 7366 TaxID=591952 RepID=UPI0039B411E8
MADDAERDHDDNNNGHQYSSNHRYLPPLPPEIWCQIIASITDSRYLPRIWLNLRLTSRFLKSVTERVFADLHLRRSRLEFLAFDPVTDAHGDPRPLDFILEFDRLSDDGSRAIYADKELHANHGPERLCPTDALAYPDRVDTVHQALVCQWRRRVEDYTAPPPHNRREVPPHVLVVRRVANDTELPDLRVDYDAFEVSFLWRPALTALFAEEEYGKWAAMAVSSSDSGSAASSSPSAVSSAAWRDLRRSLENGRINRRTLSHLVKSRLGDRRRVDAKVRQLRIRRYFRKIGQQMHPGVFLTPEYLRKTREVRSLRRDLRREVVPDEWLMGDEEEVGRGTFYDGLAMEYPASDPESEPDDHTCSMGPKPGPSLIDVGWELQLARALYRGAVGSASA